MYGEGLVNCVTNKLFWFLGFVMFLFVRGVLEYSGALCESVQRSVVACFCGNYVGL